MSLVAALLVVAFSGRAARAQGTAAAAAPVATDQPDAGFRATRGIFLPAAARAGEADATAAELNPGQLPFLTAGTAALAAGAWRASTAMPGRGAALFLATPVIGGGGFAAGLQGLASSGPGASDGHTKFQLGYGIGGRRLGIGASWARLFGGGLGGTNTFDVGAGWRPFSGVAAALVVEDVSRPRLPAAMDRLPRRWVGELALRPLGTDRLELGAAAIHLGGDSWSLLAGRFRAVVKPAGPWRWFAEVELGPRRSSSTLMPTGSDAGTDWRASAGVAIDFDHSSLWLAARRSFLPAASGNEGEGWGGAGVWHLHGDRNPAPVTSARVVTANLEGVDTDGEFLALALRLRALAYDEAVSAVLLRVEGLQLGLGRLEEVRDLVTELRRHGKVVVGYLTQASTRDLYVASACDQVIMHPAGTLIFAGLSQAVTFYKGAMDRLGVSVSLVRIAEFKGAMEPYILSGQSEPVRQNKDELLDDVYRRILGAIARGRAARMTGTPAPAARLDEAALERLVQIGSFTPAEAQKAGLIDGVRDDREIDDQFKDLLGVSSVDIGLPDASPMRPTRWTRRRVGVVMVDGTIADGKSQKLPLGLGGVVGADTVVDALEECRRDRDIRAVVLRVNSPGGAAYASDVIARAVARLRAAGKPVVASMGDVAASGGYYVSAPADVILAEPSTTTGSIGVFGFKLDVSRLLSLLSINVEVLRRGPHADERAPYRPWTDDERSMAEKNIRHMYEMFTATVAAGRKRQGLTTTKVDQVGRGHVWTGAQARQLGLVDDVGGVIAAINLAATLGRIPTQPGEAPDLAVLPRPGPGLLKTLAGLSASDESDAAAEPAQAPALRSALRLVAPYLFGPGEGIEARLPFDVDIR